MATGIYISGAPIESIYGAKGTSTAAATGIKANGVDLNATLMALADGKALGYNVGVQKAGTDLSAIFGIPTGNTPLPINGQTFSSASQSGTTTSNCSVVFAASATTYTISGSSSSGGSTPSASGAVPTGAVSVQYSYTTNSSAGSGSVTNNASVITALTGTPTFITAASSTPSTGDNHRWIGLTINFFNSAGTNISTTNITLRATATGSS